VAEGDGFVIGASSMSAKNYDTMTNGDLERLAAQRHIGEYANASGTISRERIIVQLRAGDARRASRQHFPAFIVVGARRVRRRLSR
jgi:hypothetical protein